MTDKNDVIPATNSENKLPVSIPSREVITHITNHLEVHKHKVEKVISQDEMEFILTRVHEISDILRLIALNFNELQKRSFVGKGFRNLGFLTAANNSANNNPEYVPPFISMDAYNKVEKEFLFMRDVVERLNAITKDAATAMNVLGNEAYSLSLSYYAFVQQLATRTKDPQTISVFNYLREFFRRRHLPNVEHPTEHQIERDVHALLHGHKDGRIIIENESPHTSKGTHYVVDETHANKERIELKENENWNNE